ncbi:MAG: cytochrome c oxidase subunit 3 family protein [Chloroherpetonaceae bacterium]|nr:cytochrome c oxidase subunit 3 family protein [Chloroherpetonaceae bacterium]
MSEVASGILVNTDKEAHHSHPKNLQHHFTDTEQQFDAAKMGMWLFLLTEVLLFGGLFCAYAVYNSTHPEMFKSAHTMLDWKMGAINTIVLISSSVTIALAIRSIQLNDKKQAAILLGVTLACAFVFLVIKYFEYSHKIHVGMLPGHFFNYDGSDGPIVGSNPHIFFSIYFAMTGIHGIHVLAGIGVISWILIRLLRGEFSSEYYTPVELAGLYWHLVDLIWIYLFPLLYLIG